MFEQKGAKDAKEVGFEQEGTEGMESGSIRILGQPGPSFVIVILIVRVIEFDGRSSDDARV